MQIGAYSFVVDVAKQQKASVFREYPGLSVSSAQEAAQRIRGIESGEWEYPTKACENLVDMSGRLSLDVVRTDLGLPERTDPQKRPT